MKRNTPPSNATPDQPAKKVRFGLDNAESTNFDETSSPIPSMENNDSAAQSQEPERQTSTRSTQPSLTLSQQPVQSQSKSPTSSQGPERRARTGIQNRSHAADPKKQSGFTIWDCTVDRDGVLRAPEESVWSPERAEVEWLLGHAERERERKRKYRRHGEGCCCDG